MEQGVAPGESGGVHAGSSASGTVGLERPKSRTHRGSGYDRIRRAARADTAVRGRIAAGTGRSTLAVMRHLLRRRDAPGGCRLSWRGWVRGRGREGRDRAKEWDGEWVASRAMILLAGVLFCGGQVRADDDDIVVPPLDPGIGFEGILPKPPLPRYLLVDQGTSPHGVRQVFNTPQTVMGQSFKPTREGLDWVAFVFQNNTQPNTEPGPGVVRARLYANLDRATGELSGLVGESEEVALPSNTTAWLILGFPRTLPVVPGATYYCRLEVVRGYPCWVGGRLQDFYPGGGAFGYLPNPFGGPIQDLNWGRYDLVFACGSGRGPAGLGLGVLLQWGLVRGLADYDELGDPDEDRHPTFLEYLRDGNPVGAGEDGRNRAHLVEVEGQRYLAWTLATTAGLEYRREEGSEAIASAGRIRDRFSALTRIGGEPGGGLVVIEMDRPVTNGLPPVSPFHRYRTFRLTEPITTRAQGFLVNSVSLAD